jgi:hypothetical protein
VSGHPFFTLLFDGDPEFSLVELGLGVHFSFLWAHRNLITLAEHFGKVVDKLLACDIIDVVYDCGVYCAR